MQTSITDWNIAEAKVAADQSNTMLLLVVGYDGSEPAKRALSSAAAILKGRRGQLEVVYVAQMPGAAALATSAIAEIQSGFDDAERELAEEVRNTLGSDISWRFQRRDGEVAHELLSAAEERLECFGSDVLVMVVVGGSSKRIHRYLHSVPSQIARADRFNLVVVP